MGISSESYAGHSFRITWGRIGKKFDIFELMFYEILFFFFMFYMFYENFDFITFILKQ